MLIEEPPGITAVFSDGTTAEFLLPGVASPALARDLLAGLAELVHPHGELNATESLRLYVAGVRNMVSALAAAGFTGDASGLTRPLVAQYWLKAAPWAEGSTRRLIQAVSHAGTSHLAAGVAGLAEGRLYKTRDTRPLAPYSETEWARLADTCAGVAGDSYRAHRAALAGAARGADPAIAGWSLDNLRWRLSRSGPSTLAALSADAGLSVNVARNQGGFLQASTELFPHARVVIAYRLLFGIYCGIVPDGIDDLVTGGIDWAGDAVILLSYVKGRAAAESLTLPRRAVRLLEQWLSHSALLRALVPAGQQRLWLHLAWEGSARVATVPGDRHTIRAWAVRHQVTGDDGDILRIRRDRIRTTHEAMRDKSAWWASRRAAIDPNHSPQVEGDHYLAAPTAVQQQLVDTVIADAQHDLLRRAHPPVVVTGDAAAELVREYPQLTTRLGLDDQVLAELVGGQRDVFTAACADQLSGLHGPKGKPCPARPWVCLLCPLAVFAPRHAVNLLALKGFFTRQWQAMPAAQFMAVFGPYAQRIDQVLAGYDPALLSAAGRITGDDAQLPLRPEERST
ncbi:MAG: hypothetical protein ACRDND_03890 [Streptosporangiaceae bacterium]